MSSEENSDEAVRKLRTKSTSEGTRKQYSGEAVKILYDAMDNKRPYLNPAFRDQFMRPIPNHGSVRGRMQLLKAQKQRVKDALLRPDFNLPPLLFDEVTAEQFVKYVLLKRTRKGEPVVFSTTGTSRSALGWLFKQYKQVRPEGFKADLETLYKGLKRTNARDIARGKGKIKRGKEAMQFGLYCELSELLLKATDGKGNYPRENQYAHNVLTASWNLMSRVGNATQIHVTHFDWVDDSLAVYFSYTKADQAGERPRDPRHIYANPLKPAISYILGLGLYLLTFPLEEDGTRLYPGGSQYERYRGVLKAVLATEEGEALCAKYGIEAKDIAAHSTRKGSATYVLSGSTAGPGIHPVAQRTAWSMGTVQDTYIRYANAGDQFVGRTVSGLPLDQVDFMLLPPMFNEITDNVISAAKILFPRLPIEMIRTSYFLLASLVYHSDWVMKTLPGTHPVLQSPLFTTSLLDSLKPLVVCRLPTENDTVRATGIPPHVPLMRYMRDHMIGQQELKEKLEGLVPAVVEGVARVIEEKAINAQTLTREGCQELLMDALRQGGVFELVEQIRNPQQNQQQQYAQPRAHQHPVYQYGGQFYKVPEGFVLPTGTVEQAWYQWMCRDDKRPALRDLTAEDLPKGSKERKRFPDLKYLMTKLEEKLKDHESWRDQPTVEEAQTMFEVARAVLPMDARSAKGQKRRPNQAKWSTVVNLMRNKKQIIVGLRGLAGRRPAHLAESVSSSEEEEEPLSQGERHSREQLGDEEAVANDEEGYQGGEEEKRPSRSAPQAGTNAENRWGRSKGQAKGLAAHVLMQLRDMPNVDE